MPWDLTDDKVNIASENGLVLSGNKPLPELKWSPYGIIKKQWIKNEFNITNALSVCYKVSTWLFENESTA